MKVCGVSDQWTDGPGTEEQVLIELKVGTQVSGICPLTIKMACLQCVFFCQYAPGVFHPTTKGCLGSIGSAQVGKLQIYNFHSNRPLVCLTSFLPDLG